MLHWEQLLSQDREKTSTRTQTDERKEFERDYGRVVFSTPVRRLQDKAQVFPLEPHDAVRTRLTHSLEVSTVARDLARLAVQRIRSTGVDNLDEQQAIHIETIAATCGLIHDIGNPPFGHAGEDAIRTWFLKQGPSFFEVEGIGGTTSQFAQDFLRFEGNAQTLRLLSRLQLLSHSNGLNLTYGSLSAACKYTAASTEWPSTDSPQHKKKPGYFYSENELISRIRRHTGTGDARNPITYLVEAADDIVYTVVDLEDAIKKGVIDWDHVELELKDADEAVVKDVTEPAERYIGKRSPMATSRQWHEDMGQALRIFGVSVMVNAAVETFMLRYPAIMAGTYSGELVTDEQCRARTLVKSLKRAAREHVYKTREILRLEIMGRRVIHDLMDLFWEAASAATRSSKPEGFSGKLYMMMSDNYRKVFEDALQGSGLPERYCQMQLVTDYICGMTDTFACTLHRQLTNA